jgi:enterobacterial common antigen flippase
MQKPLAIGLKLKKQINNFVVLIWQAQSGKAAAMQTLISKIFILVIHISTGVITARFLGPEGRGIQASIIIWPQFISNMMTLGLPSSLTYNLKRHRRDRSALFMAVLLLATILGAIATLIGIIFVPYWLTQYSAKVIQTAQWLMLFAPLILLNFIFMAALEAEEEFTIANQLRYLIPLFTIVSLFILVGLDRLTPFTAGASYLIPYLPVTIWSLTYLGKKFQPNFQRIKQAVYRLINYGIRSYGVDLLGVISVYLGQALVVGLLTAKTMGMYTVAFSISRMLDIMQGAIIVVLLPKTAARPTEEVVAVTTQAARISLAITFLGAAIGMIYAPLALKLLYGSEFMEGSWVLRILLIEVVLHSTTGILAQAFMALGRPGIVTILQCLGLGLSWPLMLWLIPQYGMEGAGVALLLASIVRLIFILGCYPLILKVKLPNIILNKTDLRFLQQMLFINNHSR